MDWARDFQWEALQVGLRHRWWLAGMLCGCVLIGCGAAVRIRPVYRAGATLVVEATGRDSASAVPEEIMRTLEQSSSRPEVEWAVWKELKREKRTDSRGWTRLSGGQLKAGSAVSVSGADTLKPQGWRGAARWRRGTALMDLEYESFDGQEAQSAVGAWATELVNVQEAQNAERVRVWNAAFDAEEERVRASLGEAEWALRQFRSVQGVLVLEGARSAIQEEIRALQDRLAALDLEGAGLDSDWKRVGETDGWEALIGIRLLARMEEVGAAATRLRSAESVQAGMDARYGKEHPRRIQARNEVNSARSFLREMLERAVIRFVEERKVYKERRSAMEAQLTQLEERLREQQKAVLEDQNLQRTVASEQALLDGLVARRRQSGFGADSAGYRVRILSGSALIGSAQRPGALRWVFGGGFLGLAMAGGWVGIVAAKKVRWPFLEGRHA